MCCTWGTSCVHYTNYSHYSHYSHYTHYTHYTSFSRCTHCTCYTYCAYCARCTQALSCSESLLQRLCQRSRYSHGTSAPTLFPRQRNTCHTCHTCHACLLRVRVRRRYFPGSAILAILVLTMFTILTLLPGGAMGGEEWRVDDETALFGPHYRCTPH